MRIIISPAKKMNRDAYSLPVRDLPAFLPDTHILLSRLRELSPTELKALWKCNDSILKQNISRLESMELSENLTPAILSYEGIQYQYMAPGVFTCDEFEYVQACIFAEEKNGKVIEKGTMCKMARGEMVRWLAENQISDPMSIREFDRLGYTFFPSYSDKKCLCFPVTGG